MPALKETSGARDEIADIMEEINSLQKGMAEAPAKSAAPKESPAADEEPTLSEFHGAGEEASMEDALGSLKEERQEHATPLDDVPAPAEEEAVAAPSPKPRPVPARANGAGARAPSAEGAPPGCLRMTLNGTMTLKLQYELEGYDVTIGFSENCLRVELSDGTEFKIPVRAAIKAA